MPNMALALKPLLRWLEWLRGLSFHLVPLPHFCRAWCSQSSERIKQKIWGLLTRPHLKLHRVTCGILLLIKASHSPAQLKGRENRFQLYVDVAVCSYRDGAMVAVLLQASYAKEEKGCSVS